MGGACSNGCSKCDRLVNYCSEDCEFQDQDGDLLGKGQSVNILANKIRLIVELESETKCKMDVILFNRSEQICGEMSSQNLASFHRSEIECFEDESAHVLQLDMSKVHDEIQSIEFLLCFEEARKRITASIGVVEDSLSREAICEFDLTRLAMSGDQKYSVARIKRSDNILDAWVVEATLQFDFSNTVRGRSTATNQGLHNDAYLARLLSDSYLQSESTTGSFAKPKEHDPSGGYSPVPQKPSRQMQYPGSSPQHQGQPPQQQGIAGHNANNSFTCVPVQSSLGGAQCVSPMSRGQGHVTPLSLPQVPERPSSQRRSLLSRTVYQASSCKASAVSPARHLTVTAPQALNHQVLKSASDAAQQNVVEDTQSSMRPSIEPRQVAYQEPVAGLVFGSRLSDADRIIQSAQFFPRSSGDAASPAVKEADVQISKQGAASPTADKSGARVSLGSGPTADQMYKPATFDKPRQNLGSPDLGALDVKISQHITGLIEELDKSVKNRPDASTRSSNASFDFN